MAGGGWTGEGEGEGGPLCVNDASLSHRLEWVRGSKPGFDQRSLSWLTGSLVLLASVQAPCGDKVKNSAVKD